MDLLPSTIHSDFNPCKAFRNWPEISFQAFSHFPQAWLTWASLLGLMKLVLFLKCPCLFWEWWGACVQYYVTVQVFIFYQKRREDFRFPINLLPFIRWSSGHPYDPYGRYKEERLGRQDQNRALLLSKLCFPYVYNKQQWAYLFYMYVCMDCYTYILYVQYSVCTYTDYCIFYAHEIFNTG